MTAPGPLAPQPARSKTIADIGTVLWALLPLLTCGFGAPIALSVALARHRSNATLVALVLHSVLLVAACTVVGVFGETPPLWADTVFYVGVGAASIGATVHLFVIRPQVWAPAAPPRVPIARSNGPEAVDRARQLRRQARETAAADPMLAQRLGIGRPDLPRQFDDGGLVDLNHAPVHVLRTLPGVTELSARQIHDRVERSGPFQTLGEVLLVVDISPTFEHHLREYVVFIP
ncbi:helix-hairpin-helix domain-containing protein [Glycomyces sp. L485]|uniref:ComEA family DNA-binding protein n=1 Tax=Glycomyces sp. L485 TaxID=2909235 RepID=UPI001F4ABC9B|nr:helix-hairpin-helix domain-containing protein [Glycomyces sp. L485]MCH7232904.1 helix-hairpin-helix domain-containing protein [Glycomyces sp. L485]